MSRIAVVDDEKNIREVIRITLEKEYLQAEEYADGLEAWEQFRRELPDLIVLDILMPRMDGIEVCKKVRTLPGGDRVPIIFLSSRDEEIDKVLGLESGGDDYVSKPFSVRELLARIRAGLRRTRGAREPGGPGREIPEDRPDAGAGLPALRFGDLLLDENRYLTAWKNKPIELTVTEFRIVKNLAAQPGYIKTREQLMEAAFPEDNFPNDRAADSHIKRIRKKFLEADPGFAGLESIYGLGYRWRGQPLPGGEGRAQGGGDREAPR
jgi:DNA-binding response OmpR family regulator